jgi:hypothetical protein
MKLEKWAHWAEIVASVAVVVTLVILVGEVRGNTLALERQADLDRASALTTPFFSAPQLASVLNRIKAVDGLDPLPQALKDRYGLTAEEAILWERHLWLVWLQHEADFQRSGPSPKLNAWIAAALATPDNLLYWETMGPVAGAGFRAYVDGIARAVGG